MSPAEPVTPSLCRVALLVGEDFEVDYSLPAGVALIAVTEDLVARVNEVLRERGRDLLDPEQSYRLCRGDGNRQGRGDRQQRGRKQSASHRDDHASFNDTTHASKSWSR